MNEAKLNDWSTRSRSAELPSRLKIVIVPVGENRGETGRSLGDHRQDGLVAVGGIGNIAHRDPSAVSEIQNKTRVGSLAMSG